MSDEKTESAVQAFFSHYFDYFIGKHTDWLLLNEPDTSSITAQVLNEKMKSLLQTYNGLPKQYTQKSIEIQDLNFVVS